MPVKKADVSADVYKTIILYEILSFVQLFIPCSSMFFTVSLLCFILFPFPVLALMHSFTVNI